MLRLLSPWVSKDSNSDFLEGRTGMGGVAGVGAGEAGMEKPMTEDVGSALR